LGCDVLREGHGAVTVLTVDHPPVNALHPDLAAALRSHLDEIGDDPEIRAVVLAGAGKHFMAGGDIAYFKTLDRHRAERYVLAIQSMQDVISTLPQPVIAAIDGTCLGGGLELAMACDVRIAAEHAIFGLPEVTLGIIPGAGGTQNLARLVGVGQAKRLLLSGERVDAAEALRLGLVEEVVASGAALDVALALARRIARNAPLAVAAAKRAINLGLGASPLDGQRIEASLFAPLAASEDFSEGIAAFFERRDAVFHRR
jgi:enoyl-CoA hydratase